MGVIRLPNHAYINLLQAVALNGSAAYAATRRTKAVAKGHVGLNAFGNQHIDVDLSWSPLVTEDIESCKEVEGGGTNSFDDINR